MNSWRPFPLLRLVLPFLAGIITEMNIGSFLSMQPLILALLFFLLLAILAVTRFVASYRIRWISGLVINLFLFLTGFEITWLNRSSNNEDYIGRQPEGLFVVTVAEPPTVKNSIVKTILKVRYRNDGHRWVSATGKVIGYLKLTRSNRPVQYGDFILLHAGFIKVRNNSNPHTFNYFQYLGYKNINHLVFAESIDWQHLNIDHSNVFRKYAYRFRENLLNILRSNQVVGKEFAVASALLLGYVEELDADLRNDYAATGAMHILSVSGMHVGIIYIFLEFLLGFMNQRKAGRFLKAVIILIFIWFYAMLTGLSPCVFRSAAMLSLPILGKSLNRSPDMFNVISASVFIILVVDPFLIMDVGFQLSYLAVTGIIILYRPVYDLYVTSSWLPDKIWSILAVSIAAQIATLPITFYIFHQFPNYFMLTNIFVVPLSSLIIYTGILLMVVGSIPIISVLCAKVLIALVWLLNTIIHYIEQLPLSTVQGIYISPGEMVLLYMIISAGFLYLVQKRVLYLYILLISCIIYNILIMEFKYKRLQSSRFIVYNAYQTGYYQFSMQDKSVCIYYIARKKEQLPGKYNSELARADLNAHGIRFRRTFWTGSPRPKGDIAKNFLPVYCNGRFIQFQDKRIAILRMSIPKGLMYKVKVDYLIISGNPKICIKDAVNIFNPDTMIIDATNSRMRTKAWLKDASVQGVVCQSVTEQGAFEKEFSKEVGK